LRGDYVTCLALCAEIRQLSDATGNQHGQLYARWLLGFIYADYGEIERAIEAMHEAIRLSVEYNFMPAQISTPIMLGWVYGAMGDLAQGIEWLNEVLQRIKAIDALFWSDPLPMLTRLYLRQGDLALAESTLAECYAHTNLSEPTSFSALWIGIAATEFYLAQQNYAEAIQSADIAINKFQQLGIRPYLAELLYLKGVAQMQLGQFTAAEVNLTAAHELATTMQLRFILWAIADSLSEVKTELGQTEVAATLQQEAHDLVEFIITHSPPHLGQSFAKLPQVRDVMKDIN
jgi:tetratricopeptide (TPR) repeat protein